MMACNDDQMFKCSNCKSGLDMESKTLACLHSFCEICVDKKVQGHTSENSQCPQCGEIVKSDQLTLSPVWVGFLKSRQIESKRWKCDLCWEDGEDSIATNWCKDCDKFFCYKCNRLHSKLPPKQHNSIELTLIGEQEIREAMKTDMCKIHNKVENSYCDRCNVCLCDTCYTRHVKDSCHCSSRPMSVRAAALKKQKLQGPTLLKEIEDLEKFLREKRKKSQIHSDKLERECVLKCEELGMNFEHIIQELRKKIHKLCEELEWITKQQIEKSRKFQYATERMLKKLEIWRINLRHLLKKERKEKDIVFGIDMVERKFASLSSPEFHLKIRESVREILLQVQYTSYWKQFLQGLQKEMIGSGILHYSGNFVQFENEFYLQGSNKCRLISSILVSDKDNHIFLADYSNRSIIELKESGEFLSELILTHEGENFLPREMFFNAPEILGVNCGLCGTGEERLLFLERENFSSLKIKQIVNKKKTFTSFSVCQFKKAIIFCNYQKLQFDFYTEKGEYIKTVDTGLLNGHFPRIRVDHSTGNIWGAVQTTSKIFCFNKIENKIQSIEIGRIWNFSINESGEIYFCNSLGIFAFFPKNHSIKYLYKFEKTTKRIPSIFVSREKIYVCREIEDDFLIEIHKFLEL